MKKIQSGFVFKVKSDGSNELGAGKVTIKNNSKEDKLINIYVPNKDYVACILAAGATLVVNVANAGECFEYMKQATEELTVTFAPATTG